MRSGGVGETRRNYTGQKLDDTGLLFYNARYYDPALARFLTPDASVPKSAAGAAQNSRLIVDLHESGFLSILNGENKQTLSSGFWFQLSPEDQKKNDIRGPSDPEELNRYSYVLNNPLGSADPTGHFAVHRGSEANDFLNVLDLLMTKWNDIKSGQMTWQAIQSAASNLGPSILQFIQGVYSAIASDSMPDDMMALLQWMHRTVAWLNGNDARLSECDWVDFNLVESFSPGRFGGWTFYAEATMHTMSGALPPEFEHQPWNRHRIGYSLFYLLAHQPDRSGLRPWPVYREIVRACTEQDYWNYGDMGCPYRN